MHTECRQPSSLGVSAGRLQQGQRLSRSQGEPGTSGSTPDITGDGSQVELETKVAEDYAKFYNHGEGPC